MKTTVSSRKQGSVLMITVCTVAIIGMGLVSYLWLVHSKNRLASRSLHWNLAMAHAEAGIEEALAQLNHKFGKDIDLTANGWGSPSAGYYGPVTRNLSLSSGRYSAKISTDTLPIIHSTGYATNPMSGGVVARTVEVKTRYASAFQVGMAAKLDITFKGNDVHIDSYDSSDSTKSTDGEYDPAKAQSNGDVASTDGFVEVGNANINGKIKTGPGGNYSFGPNGYAGPVGWTGPGLYAPDWYKNDFNMDFKDVDPPYPNGFSLPPSLGVGTNDMILLGGTDYYHSGNLKKTGVAKTILVTGGVVRLYVTGNLEIPTGWEIKIEPGSTFKVYVGDTTGGPTKGEFGMVNTSSPSKAATFQYYGLPNNNSVSWSGNQAYKGTIYAPQATFTLGGGGNNTYDYQGACTVYNVVMNGHFNFHYDEDLKRKDPYSGYTAGSWREL